MAVLRSETRNQVLLSDLKVARRFFERGKGLLGRMTLPANEALWILRCNSIHTFFMMFPIDCVFVNRNLEVKALRRNVVPWRMVFPIWGASSVIEMAAGSIDRLEIKTGEKLHVGA
ncbi:MAG: DUF192 domain-containing protein [Bdellovibrionaceae bacterium]|nr:DUF192 domain-containing protein [Pseudobdellovibrionaceae bacterium]